MEDELLTIEQVMEMTGKSKGWVYYQMQHRGLPFTLIPRQERCSVYRFKKNDIEEHLKQKKVKQPPQGLTQGLNNLQWIDIARAIKR